MRRYFIIMIAALIAITQEATAQIFTPRLPIYIVNGERMDEQQVKAIDPADIVSNQLLPVDEALIEKYGHDAANGVVVITLRYDTPAAFIIDGREQSYSAYIARQVKWESNEPVARVVISFKVLEDGTVQSDRVLEATDRRLLRRIQRAMEEGPKWRAAVKDGKGMESEHILRIMLPEGKQMPREGAILIR